MNKKNLLASFIAITALGCTSTPATTAAAAIGAGDAGATYKLAVKATRVAYDTFKTAWDALNTKLAAGVTAGVIDAAGVVDAAAIHAAVLASETVATADDVTYTGAADAGTVLSVRDALATFGGTAGAIDAGSLFDHHAALGIDFGQTGGYADLAAAAAAALVVKNNLQAYHKAYETTLAWAKKKAAGTTMTDDTVGGTHRTALVDLIKTQISPATTAAAVTALNAKIDQFAAADGDFTAAE